MRARPKEHSKEVEGKIIAFHFLGIGCEIISKRLDIPESPSRSILRKWKLYNIPQALVRQGLPSKPSTKTKSGEESCRDTEHSG